MTINENLRPIGRDLRSSKGFTMCVVVRDEMYLISDFLNHYRALGVERFIVLDDRSEDGTREFLLAEPDVMVVESPLRFNDPVPVPKEVTPYRQTWRALYLWRNQLMDMAGYNKVHLMVDADEFLVLPEGATLQDAAKICRRDQVGTILGVMLDVYPRYSSEIERMASITDGSWYFDALPHLRLRPRRHPKNIYGGARARLYSKTGALPVQPARRRLRMIFRKRLLRKLTVLHKPILIYWRTDSLFLDSHKTIGVYMGNYCQSALLPVIHYKFIPPIYEKVRCAIKEKQYFNESEDHRMMAQMMRCLDNDPKGFMGRDSRPVTGWFGFERSGNAFGI